MNAISISEIRQIVAGELAGAAPGDQAVSTVCINSREMRANSLFIAIKGENHDGHHHLAQAAASGAVAAMVQEIPADAPAALPLIRVPHTRIAMGMIARHVRRQLRGKVIGVAGSNGKTSTKYLIDAALSQSLRGSISPKSFNNDIGVPLAIFPADPQQDYLVLEMGTNHHGEILTLTKIAEPDVAVVTNIGAEHLEFLGDLAGVRRENATVIQGLNPGGMLIVNGDDPEFLQAISDYSGQVTTFGFKRTNDLFAADIVCENDGVRFKLNGRDEPFSIPWLGQHNAANTLAAVAVARHLGVSDQAIRQGLSAANAPEMRLQMNQVNGISVLNDAYNANPDSMRAALETVRDLPVTDGRRIAILGDMRELGETSDRYHREVGEFAATCGLDSLYCVGDQSRLTAESAQAAGMNQANITFFASATELAATIRKRIRRGDLVLLKASRTVQLEKVADAIGDFE